MLHRVKSRNIVSFLLDSDIKEANNANMVDPDDDENIDIELWTTSLGFALLALVQIRLVSNSSTVLFHTSLANYASYLFCWRCYS